MIVILLAKKLECGLGVVLVGLAENACYPVCYCVVNCSFLSISDVGPSSRNEALFIYIYTEFVYDC
jgi:hypothetical protein